MTSDVRFETLWRRLSLRGDASVWHARLLECYAEPQRAYHTLQHLEECLSLLSRNLHLAVEPAEVEISLWFHDAIYNVTARDNEARSAEWAEEELSRVGVNAERIERVKRHILATRHAVLPQGQDQKLLVDVDLSILGAARARFEEYEAQVREEYSWVPEPHFRQRRAEVLAEFLERQPIYNTSALRESHESQARENLAYSLQKLRGGG